MLGELTRPPHGSTLNAVNYLLRLNDIAQASAGENHGGEMYWNTMFNQALTCAIDLCTIGRGRPRLEDVKEVMITSPPTPKAAHPDAMTKDTGKCARFIRRGMRRVCKPSGSRLARTLERCIEFFTIEYASIGSKGRGAIGGLVNAVVGRLLLEPWFTTFGEATTLAFEQIDSEGLIAIIDCPILKYGETYSRLFTLAWIMGYQAHLLRRDPVNARRALISRDECPYFIHPAYEAQVQAVARGQRCIHMSLFQEFDLMETAFGGGAKAKSEAMSTWSNHGVKVMFRQDNPDTAEIQSRLLGDEEQIQMGGSSGQGGGGFLERVFNATGNWNFNLRWERRVRASDFSRLKTGQCLVLANGELAFLDLYEGGAK